MVAKRGLRLQRDPGWRRHSFGPPPINAYNGPWTTKVKICGLKTEAALEAALAGGADYVGPRVLSAQPPQRIAGDGKLLADKARGRAKIVALLVDPDDALIEAVIAVSRSRHPPIARQGDA